MIVYKSLREINIIKEGAEILSKTLGEVSKYIKEGVTTQYLDKIAEEFILDNKAISAFKNYNGFPATLCISINNEVVHGLPSNRSLKDGDIVSIDCGVKYKGYYSDSAYTFPVGNVSKEASKLLDITKESLFVGIANFNKGSYLMDLGSSIQNFVEANGFNVVRSLVGHGIGKKLHEEPNVPNYKDFDSRFYVKAGLVVAIEPMVVCGDYSLTQSKDGWTIVTLDGSLAAHFEHTVAVYEDKTEILTNFAYIEERLKI
ncbi:MAG: type I methionyl aminopeptidase [Solitalea-like symbiont of Acarus siro]